MIHMLTECTDAWKYLSIQKMRGGKPEDHLVAMFLPVCLMQDEEERKADGSPVKLFLKWSGYLLPFQGRRQRTPLLQCLEGGLYIFVHEFGVSKRKARGACGLDIL